jgi:2-oxoglutarate ferredoxin oxidoreductase subunit alpha
MPTTIAGINDFVVKFANVNGSGSASANLLFAKSILRMGVPVASRSEDARCPEPGGAGHCHRGRL